MFNVVHWMTWFKLMPTVELVYPGYNTLAESLVNHVNKAVKASR